MSTVTLRESLAPTRSGGFSRLYKTMRTWIDVFSEAQRMAREAERRFTYARW